MHIVAGSAQRLSILAQVLRQDDVERAAHQRPETTSMPKVIVLFFGADSATIALADGAAEGAKGVRFTELEIRSGSAEQSTIRRRHRQLESASRIREFDGVILACPSDGGIPADMVTLFDELERSSQGPLTNTVFGIVGGDNTPMASRVLRIGGILVGAPAHGPDAAPGSGLGARVATVAAWVRHALSHEHQHESHTH
jgi:hypothetical protein